MEIPDYVYNYYAAYVKFDDRIERHYIDDQIYSEMIAARGLEDGERLNVTEKEYAMILLRSK